MQDRLLAAGAVAAARRAQLRATIDSEAQAAATFHPAINHNAASLAGRRPTARSHSASATRPSRWLWGRPGRGLLVACWIKRRPDAGASPVSCCHWRCASMQAPLSCALGLISAAPSSLLRRPRTRPFDRPSTPYPASSRLVQPLSGGGESEAGGEGSSSSSRRRV